MNRYLFSAAFALGLLALLWVGAGFVGTSAMALLMTGVMAGVFGLGAWELARFRAATRGLDATLGQVPQPMEVPDSLNTWLAGVPPTLQHTVRQRIEGERTGLPGPGLTPYLVGLLVMLGMLGTFLGMVVTFKGAVFALEGSADLQAIRAALAAPIKGLGLAFGTSVAGVAASAMLGLMSAVARRERADVGRALDACVATVFRPFSLVHQRQETFKALQAQSLAMPRVVDSLQTLVDGLERRSQQLNVQLLDQQAQFHRDAAQSAGDALQRTVQAAMAEMVQASAQAHQRQMDATQQQLAGVATQFGATAQAVSSAWEQAQQGQAHTQRALVDGLAQTLATFTHTFEQRSTALLATVQDAQARAQADLAAAEVQRHADWARTEAARAEADTRHEHHHTERLAQLTTLWRTELAALRQDEAERGQAAVARLAELQTALAQHLATLGAALEAPMARMVATASEVPQAAAGVIVQLRQEMARLAERDNHALAERTELVGQLNALLQGMGQAATHTSASAVELASVGEAFGHGMGLFSATHGKLTDGLARLEATLQQTMARSDEQLAYYVAQAREVIDLSIAAQQGIVEDLRRLHTEARAA